MHYHRRKWVQCKASGLNLLQFDRQGTSDSGHRTWGLQWKPITLHLLQPFTLSGIQSYLIDTTFNPTVFLFLGYRNEVVWLSTCIEFVSAVGFLWVCHSKACCTVISVLKLHTQSVPTLGQGWMQVCFTTETRQSKNASSRIFSESTHCFLVASSFLSGLQTTNIVYNICKFAVAMNKLWVKLWAVACLILGYLAMFMAPCMTHCLISVCIT